MKTNFFSIEENQFILDLIHNNNNKTKNELMEFVVKLFNDNLDNFHIFESPL